MAGRSPLDHLQELVGRGALEDALFDAADEERGYQVSAVVDGSEDASVATAKLLTLLASGG